MGMKQSILLKNVRNARELGGYPVKDGKNVKSGVLLRTAKLTDITDEEINILREQYHVGDIVDFRMPMEIMDDFDPTIEGVKNTHLDVIYIPEEIMGDMDGISMEAADIAQLADAADKMGMMNDDMYIGFLSCDKGKKAFSEFFRILLSAGPDKAVLWHCTGGKDRTGVAAMLILSALGADETTILDDYALTNEYNARYIERTKMYMKQKGFDDTFINKAILVFDAVDRSFMEKALAFLKTTYGSALNYIKTELNVSNEEIALLKEKYTV